MTELRTIAIDGPAASGKSTVAARLSERLDYLFFDTGVMYRAVTWAVLDRGVAGQNEAAVSELAEGLTIEVIAEGPDDGRQATVLVDGQDVTWDIREAAVEAQVSQVSAYPRVRRALTRQQRRIALEGPVVMVGRDIGTVVLPYADLKVFMEASAAERARRRYAELEAQGKAASVDFAEVLAAMVERDKQDREKPISPLVPADDAVIVNTDGLSIDQVVARLIQLVARQ